MGALKLVNALLVTLVFCGVARASEGEGKKEGGGEKEHEGGGEGAKEKAEALGPSDHYVHKWLKFPDFAGTALSGGEGSGQVGARPGRAIVVIFIASWCEPCQQLVPTLRNLEKRYQRLNTDFHFVFSHDTADDAAGFMKEFGINNAVLANHDILKTFHNPDLPAIYVGDRSGWLATRFLKADQESVQKLDEFLKYISAY